MMGVYEISRQYAERGYVCIPCNVYLDDSGNKHADFPAGGYKQRRFDLPEDWEGFSGLAINTALSGVVAVDIDCGAGKDGFAGLESAGIDLPDTPMVATSQSGGKHLLYRATSIPVPQSSGRLAAGVDVRGDASGILYAYPTKVDNGGGAYTWDGPAVAVADLPEFPVELAQRLTGAGVKQSKRGSRSVTADCEPANVEVSAEQRAWALRRIDLKLGDIAGAGAGERNERLGKAVPRIIGLTKTIGGDLEEAADRILAAYAESGGNDRDQAVDWINSSIRDVAPEDPSGWLPVGQASFWDARPELRQIRQAAQAGMASPWAVLGALCVRVLADVPPTHRLITGIGDPEGGNLNLFAVLAAESGGGKGIATQVARYLWPSDVYSAEIASGEALPRLFAQKIKDPATGIYVNSTVRDSVIIDAPEFGSLSASGTRSGATLTQRLCNGFSGEGLSFAVADDSKNVDVPANSYRLGVITGIQYGNAGMLLAEGAAVTGLPQRFVWFPANVGADEIPQVRPDTPAPLHRREFPPGRSRIEVCDEAKRDLEAAQRVKLIGDTSSPLDGHKLYARAKLAYALAVLNRHYCSVRPEDWELAGVVMEVSDATRQRAVDTLSSRERKAAEAAGKRDGMRKAVAAETEAEESHARIAANVLRLLGAAPEGMPKVGRHGLRHKLRSSQREYLDDVLADLVAEGRVIDRGDWVKLIA